MRAFGSTSGERGQSRPEYLYRRAEDYIEGLIRQRNFGAGDLIPGRKVLAERLGVNQLTVRRAIENLVRRRVLVTHQGKGTFVAQRAQLDRVLWVCGDDIFSGDISPFYTDFMRFSRDACREHGLAIEPVFLSNGRPADSRPFCAPDATRGYAGFIFVACDLTHPLLEHVATAGLPHVHTTDRPGLPRSVTANNVQALQLALEHFSRQGCRHLTIMCPRDSVAELRPLLAETPMTAQFTEHHLCPRMSDSESEGYRLMHELLAHGALSSGLLVLDDIVARGVTRAMLETGYHTHCEVETVVICGRQEVMPLGVPVTFVVFDTEQLVGAAVRILYEQITRAPASVDFYVAEFGVLPESFAASRPWADAATPSRTGCTHATTAHSQ